MPPRPQDLPQDIITPFWVDWTR